MDGGRAAAVVEHRERAVGLHHHVVLERGLRAGPHLEVVLVGAERPDHRARLVVDLVHRPGVAHRDDQVAIGIERDRVQVVGVEHKSGRALLEERLGDRDVVERVPLEQHEPGLDVDLLDDGIHQRPPHPGVVHRRDAHDVGVALGRDEEIVQVHALQPVGGLDGGDLLVLAVVDHALAASAAVVGVPLPPGQNRLPVQLLHAEIRGELVRQAAAGTRSCCLTESRIIGPFCTGPYCGVTKMSPPYCSGRLPVDRDRRRLAGQGASGSAGRRSIRPEPSGASSG